MGILDGIVDWLATQVMNLLDLASTSVLGALGCNMDTFKRYFPAASSMYEIFIWTAIGLVLLNLVWQLYRCYGAGFDIDTENPINLVVRSVIFLLLIWYCDDIVIDDSVGGHVSYNAFQLISMYCAYQGQDDYTKISLANLSAQVQAHRTEYYTYTTSAEIRTEPVQKEVREQTITVQEDHTYTVFTLSYVGDDYFADTVWQLDEKQKSYADAYAHNLTVYLHEIEEREGFTILGQISDALIDDTSPAPSGGFGNPFNDPNWEQHITSFFGKREDVGIPGKDTTNHNGLDIAYPYGTPILAVEAGTVIKAGYHVSYGNYLVINHGGGYCTLYAHCSQLLAQVGDKVNKYDTIAKVGATGDVTGNHLHICVIIDGVYVNPKGYLH